MIALVAVSAAVYASDKPYSYQIPPDMDVQPGIRVIVPFGRGNKRCEGIVLGLQSGHGEGLKPIERVMDLDPVLSAEFLRMAAFLRERYFCTYYDAVKAGKYPGVCALDTPRELEFDEQDNVITPIRTNIE